MAKKQEYTPSVQQGQMPDTLEPADDKVRIQAYHVGEAVMTASMNVRDTAPGWAALFDQIYYQLNAMLGD